MTLGLITAASFLTVNLLGLLVSLRLEARPIPDGLSVQTQQRKPHLLRARLPLIGLNVGMMTMGSLVGMTLATPWLTTHWPGLTRFAADFGLVLLVDDLVFYGVHRLIHTHRGLYKALHRLHHKAYAPLPIEYISVHPGELSMGALGTLFGAISVVAVWGSLSFPAFLAYTLFRALHELDIHSGVRGAIGRSVPFFAPNEHHDLHHHWPHIGNYASMLTLWDHVFGTYVDNDIVRPKQAPGWQPAPVSVPSRRAA